MVITCPNCGSTFNLADDQVVPERRVRCSICSHIFHLAQGMPEAADNPFLTAKSDATENAEQAGVSDTGEDGGPTDQTIEQSPSKKKKNSAKSKPATIILAAVLLLLIVGGALWFLVFRDSSAGGGSIEAEAMDQARRISEIAIDKRRQSIVDNRVLGNILVIDGEVANMGDSVKHYIQLEASLIDPDGVVVMRKPIICGPVLSESQLQSMGEAGIESWLSNMAQVIDKNVNVPKNGRVPFMVVFYRLPPEMLESPARYSYRLTVMEALEKLPTTK